MRNRFSKAVCVLALVFLVACAPAAPSSSVPVPASSAPQPEETDPQPAAQTAGPLRFYDLKDGSANEDGYYQILTNPAGTSVLTCTDFASGQRRILCGRSGCVHTDETCPAFVCTSAGQPRLVAQQNRVVLVHPRLPALGRTPPTPARVEVRASDGTGSRTVVTFEPDEAPGLYCAADRDNLYTLIDTLSDGGSVRDRRLARVHLDDGTVETLARLSHPRDNVMIQGVFENRVVMKRIFEGGLSRQVPTEEWDAKINSQIHGLFFIDDQGQEHTLVHWRQYQAAGFVYGDACYLFYENGDLHKADFSTGRDTVLASFGSQWGKNFVDCPAKIGDMLVIEMRPRDSLPGQTTISRFAVDTVQGGATPLPQQILWEGWRQPVPILYADDRWVLAVWGTRPAAAGEFGQWNGQCPVWGVLDAEDFLAGNRFA